MTETIDITDLKTATRDVLGGHYPRSVLIRVNDADRLFEGVEGREAYLAWVADCKALIKQIETRIRALKAERRNPSDFVRDVSQMKAAELSLSATALILKRRAGKAWSLAQKRARVADAA